MSRTPIPSIGQEHADKAAGALFLIHIAAKGTSVARRAEQCWQAHRLWIVGGGVPHPCMDADNHWSRLGEFIGRFEVGDLDGDDPDPVVYLGPIEFHGHHAIDHLLLTAADNLLAAARVFSMAGHEQLTDDLHAVATLVSTAVEVRQAVTDGEPF